jgi:hypothetical protein
LLGDVARKSNKQSDVEHVEEVMRKFVREYPDAILFGGWATYLRTGVAKSHDIDVIVDHATLGKVRLQHQLTESRHVGGRMFEIKVDGVPVDVYPVLQSRLGRRLQLPVETLFPLSERIEGMRVLASEAQFAAKMAALLDRPDSLPGEKDRKEMWALLRSNPGLDFVSLGRILNGAGWKSEQQAELLSTTFDRLEETPGLSKTERSKIHDQRRRALESVRQQDKNLELDL